MERPATIRRARRLRQDASAPERRAWKILRKLRLTHGLTVRRQHPIAGLTVDFAIRSKRLVIEIDGPLHRLEHIAADDAKRDARLRAEGWKVLRISHEFAGAEDELINSILTTLDT